MKNQKFMIRTLTNRSFRQNRGRNAVAVLAVVLTTMMFTTLFTLAGSMEKNMTEMYFYQAGTRAHASAKQITDDQIKQISAHPDVAAYGRSIVAGVAENACLAGRQLEIRFADDQYARDAFAYPATGKMPEREDEIALDTMVLERLGVPQKIGEKVTLEWKKDIHGTEVTESTFTLCGFWEGNASVYASMAWVSEGFVQNVCGEIESPEEGQILGMRMMGITFSDDRDIQGKTEKVLEDCGLTEVEFKPNYAYTEEVQQSILMENLPMYGGMLLVFLAGYLIIFNVYQISVTKDILFYGKLKTLGMTKKQIKKLIFGESRRISLMGIPLGLLVGYALGVLLVPALIAPTGIKPSVSANPVIFLGSSLFAFLTVVISCLLPARAAGKVSPIEALRYTDGDSGSGKKRKKTRKRGFLAGMAWENLWRNKKRTVLVLLSLSLGLVLMSFFYAKNASFDVEKYVMDITVADYQIDDATNDRVDGYDPESKTISRELQEEIQALGTAEETGYLYSKTVELSLNEETKTNLREYFTEERLSDFASYYPPFSTWKEEYDRALSGEKNPYTLYGASGLILEAAASDNYIFAGTYDADKFAAGGYCLAIGTDIEPGSGMTTFAPGEKVEIGGREFEVMAVLLPLRPMTDGWQPNFDLPLVISGEEFRELWPDSNVRKFYVNVPEENLEETEHLLKEYQQTRAQGMNIVSRKTVMEQYEAETRASSVMGYAISVIIALVGVLNFVNSMVTAIISRKREFAMIQSVGMTKRQLGRMLTAEGLYYAGLTLLVSYILGAFAVGVILRGMVSAGYSTFHFTLLPLGVCTPILLFGAVFIPWLCFKNLEKQSVVERLRRE